MRDIFDGPVKDGNIMARQAFPIIHSYFIQLISEKTPSTRQMFRSSITIFTAFKQINYLGAWSAVRHIKQTAVMLKYCFRSIVFLDMLLEKGELNLDNDVLLMDEVDDRIQDQGFADIDDMTTDGSSMED